MANIIKVGMADLNAGRPSDVLQTCGLGSCIGICLWDPVTKVGGLAHIMLPSSVQAKGGSPAKFADTAVPLLIDQMKKLGADKNRLVAKIAGGAQMFSFYSNNDLMKIGDRNAEAVKKELEAAKIRIIAQDTGGNFGRTIELYNESGKLYVRTINLGEKYI